MISKVEIRVTRLDLYQNKKDLSGHQGHYFTAKTFQDAVTTTIPKRKSLNYPLEAMG